MEESHDIKKRKEKKRRKKVWKAILIVFLLLILAAGSFYLYRWYMSTKMKPSESVMTYRTSTVTEGEITSVVSGSATLTARKTYSPTAPADVTVETVLKEPGQAVSEGEVVMTLSSDAVQQALEELYDELSSAQSKLAGTTRLRSNRNITSPRKGIVKDIQVTPGDAAEEKEYLCKISTDGKMRIAIPYIAGLRLYETVKVTIDGETVEGVVNAVSDSEINIIFDDNSYSIGIPASVTNESDTLLGTGTADVNDYVLVRGETGCINSVKVGENSSVNKGGVLFVLREGALSPTYLTRLAEVTEIENEIKELEDALVIKAPWDGLFASVSAAAGDELTTGSSLCTLTSSDGYTLAIGIDEDDISSVNIGASATVTLSALEGTYTGSVTNLSYSGSGSYITSYTATVTTEPIQNAFPGMSATAKIVTQSSGKACIVSVSAVQYEGPNSYLYLASDSNEPVTDLSSLQKVPVTTGMSDGSYIVVSGEGVRAGVRIIIPTLTTTAVYTESQSTSDRYSQMTGFGNFGGGGMPDFGGTMPGFGGMGSSYGGSGGSQNGTSRSSDRGSRQRNG